MWLFMVGSVPFTDPFTATAGAPRSFHVVGNASETVPKRSGSMYVYGRSQLGPYTLHRVNKHPPIHLWVTHATVH